MPRRSRWRWDRSPERSWARRPYRIPLADAALEEQGPGALALRFSLPPGSFALAVLREVVKDGQQPDLE